METHVIKENEENSKSRKKPLTCQGIRDNPPKRLTLKLNPMATVL